jgi:preprotein translocase subunit SecG
MVMYYAITTLHVIVCVILVLVVLLQSGKGADLAGAFGGGATQTAFGSRGPASFLSKMTTVAAIIFMLTSIGLSMISTPKASNKSVLETGQQEAAAPAEKAPATQPPPAIPTREEIGKELEKLDKEAQEPQAAPTTGQEGQPASSPPESD